MQLPLGWTGFIANTRIRTFTPLPPGGCPGYSGVIRPVCRAESGRDCGTATAHTCLNIGLISVTKKLNFRPAIQIIILINEMYSLPPHP